MTRPNGSKNKGGPGSSGKRIEWDVVCRHGVAEEWYTVVAASEALAKMKARKIFRKEYDLHWREPVLARASPEHTRDM